MARDIRIASVRIGRNGAVIIVLMIMAVMLVWAKAPSAHSQKKSVEPVTIPLAGPLESRQAEISGLAWYGDWLVLLPQFPWFHDQRQSFLYGLPKTEIVDFLDGRTAGPLTPRPIPLDATGVAVAIPGFEGFESIAFAGDRVFVTVEASLGSSMQGWLLSGEITPDLSGIRVDVESRTPIAPQASFINMSDEAIVLRETPNGVEILTFYEANGRLANPKPVVNRFDANLRPLSPLPMPHVEYRITDATTLDAEDRFWISNYFWPGEVQILLGGNILSARLRAPLRREDPPGRTPGGTRIQRRGHPLHRYPAHQPDPGRRRLAQLGRHRPPRRPRLPPGHRSLPADDPGVCGEVTGDWGLGTGDRISNRLVPR